MFSRKEERKWGNWRIEKKADNQIQYWPILFFCQMVNTRSFLLNEQNVELFPKICGDGNCSGNTYLVIVEGPCKMNVVPVVTTPEYIKDSDLLKVTRNKHLSFSVIFRNIVT